MTKTIFSLFLVMMFSMLIISCGSDDDPATSSGPTTSNLHIMPEPDTDCDGSSCMD